MAEEAASIKDLDRSKQDVVRLRDNVLRTVEELERRGHELFDWRLQLRKHAVAIGLGTLAIVFVISAPIAIAAWSRAKR
jgi:hypothetical protein